MARPRSAPASSGFTLLEVLVVLLIMGLLLGLVSAVMLPDDGDRLGLESERLARLLALAGEEARMSGRAVAWTAEADGFRFWQQDPETGWQPMAGRDLLRARDLPAGMAVLAMRIENTAVAGPPRLEFSSNGTSTAFAIELGLGTARATVAGSPVGAVTVAGDGDGPDALLPAR